jgi:hypothetical protein
VDLIGTSSGPKNVTIFANATALTVEVALAELSAKPTLHFSLHRSRGAISFAVREGDVAMQKGGRLTVGVGPNELVTLRSQ